MTETAEPDAFLAAELERAEKEQVNLEKVLESLDGLQDDIEQMGKLLVEEQHLVAQIFALLGKLMRKLEPSVEVSTNVLPLQMGDVSQAYIDPTGHLTLTFEDGRQRLIDLAAVENRDLLVVVFGDVLLKLQELTDLAVKMRLQKATAKKTTMAKKPKPRKSSPVKVLTPPVPITPATAPEPPQVPVVPVEVPVSLPEPAPLEPLQPLQVPSPSVSIDTAKIVELEAETQEYLQMLGNEVFEQAPVSKYFDDWMVNLRQVIMSFESNETIGPDSAFTDQCNTIFGNIEDELAKRQATDADIEVSLRRLVENRYLLNKIDEGYAAQTKELVVKGKSAIEYLTRNVQQLEAELVEAAQIKTSYRHPLQKMAKDQKISELTQKLAAAKKRLALAVGNSSVDRAKSGNIDADYAAQAQELAEKRKSALDILTQEVHSLDEELVQIEKAKTLNILKRVQQRFDTTQKLLAAKKRL
jgi:phage host-nuclease inhibitor protein Gam